MLKKMVEQRRKMMSVILLVYRLSNISGAGANVRVETIIDSWRDKK
jgi:hypothetical protein